jgi:cobalt-zinc-cadmium efflux system protein
MSNSSTHCHNHEHNGRPDGVVANINGHTLALAVVLTLAFVIGEAISGFVGHSLALLSDAGHNFADAAALAFSWYALWIAKKPSNRGMTYGYHRVGILAALVNAGSVCAIALLIIAAATDRLRHPQPVAGGLMVIVAAVAIGLNVLIGIWLHAGAKNDLNVRSAYLHMLGDALSAFGVVLAGIIVILTRAQIADVMVSFLIAVLILWTSWGVLKESITVLLEATPVGIDMQRVEQTIQAVPGVLGIHDLHVWTVGPGAIAASLHFRIAEQTVREGQQILRGVAEKLAHDFRINHSTVQIEVEGHCRDEMYCCIEPAAEAHLGHHH